MWDLQTGREQIRSNLNFNLKSPLFSYPLSNCQHFSCWQWASVIGINPTHNRGISFIWSPDPFNKQNTKRQSKLRCGFIKRRQGNPPRTIPYLLFSHAMWLQVILKDKETGAATRSQPRFPLRSQPWPICSPEATWMAYVKRVRAVQTAQRNPAANFPLLPRLWSLLLSQPPYGE